MRANAGHSLLELILQVWDFVLTDMFCSIEVIGVDTFNRLVYLSIYGKLAQLDEFEICLVILSMLELELRYFIRWFVIYRQK